MTIQFTDKQKAHFEIQRTQETELVDEFGAGFIQKIEIQGLLSTLTDMLLPAMLIANVLTMHHKLSFNVFYYPFYLCYLILTLL